MKKCQVEGCEREYYAKSFCKLHYEHQKHYGRVFTEPIINRSRVGCLVQGCDGKHKGHGYCDRHYQQITKLGGIQGDPTKTKFDPNDYVEKEEICEIILTDEHRKERGRAIIDKEDLQVVICQKWCLTTTGYAKCGKIDRTLSEFLMGVKTSWSVVIDHINQNKLDYRRRNLRVCDKSQNALNSKIHIDNTSGNSGVSWDSTRKKWAVQLRIGKVLILNKRFDTKEEAIYARKMAFEKYVTENAK